MGDVKIEVENENDGEVKIEAEGESTAEIIVDPDASPAASPDSAVAAANAEVAEAAAQGAVAAATVAASLAEAAAAEEILKAKGEHEWTRAELESLKSQMEAQGRTLAEIQTALQTLLTPPQSQPEPVEVAIVEPEANLESVGDGRPEAETNQQAEQLAPAARRKRRYI